jgi:hypothetical protein
MGISAGLGTAGLQPAVCTSTTRPAAPYEGQMIYETDTNRLVLYNGSSWVYIADTDTPPGLELITTASWATGGTLSINNCFTSTFSSYRILIRNAKHATTSVNILFRLRASGTDKGTDSYYHGRRYIPMGGSGGGDTGASNSGEIIPGIVAAVSNAGSGVIDIHDPQKSAVTTCTFQGVWSITTGESSSGAGFLNNTTSYDGFTLIANTGNFTSLDVAVYGYRGS